MECIPCVTGIHHSKHVTLDRAEETIWHEICVSLFSRKTCITHICQTIHVKAK